MIHQIKLLIDYVINTANEIAEQLKRGAENEQSI